MAPVSFVAVLAIDIGGTKLAAGVVDHRGDLHAVRRRPTPAHGPADVLFEAVRGVAAEALDEWSRSPGRSGGDGHSAARPPVVGVGCGGPMAPGGEAVSPLNIPGWRDFPLRRRLAECFGGEVFIDNDAKALALAEGWRGAARGATDYLAMVVSTGVGAGVVVDGRLLHGATSNAGHLGHVIVEPEGRRCGCGASGCLEAEASGTALAAMTGRPAAEAPLEWRRRTGRMVGRAVASAVNLLDLRLAVVGGSVALGFGGPFFAAANEELSARSRLSFTAGATIVPSPLGGDGPLIGAAAVARAGLGWGDERTTGRGGGPDRAVPW